MALPPYKAPDKKELRRFGLLVGGLFIGLFIALPWLRHHPVPRWPWVPGGLLITLGAVSPTSLSQVHRGWTFLGHVLGWINLRIILTVVFFVVLTPIGLIQKLLGKDTLGRAARKDSYRVESVALSPDRMKRPF